MSLSERYGANRLRFMHEVRKTAGEKALPTSFYDETDLGTSQYREVLALVMGMPPETLFQQGQPIVQDEQFLRYLDHNISIAEQGQLEEQLVDRYGMVFHVVDLYVNLLRLTN